MAQSLNRPAADPDRSSSRRDHFRSRFHGHCHDPDALRAKFEAAGVTDDSEEVITYCNSGVSSSLGLLAYRAAGFEGGAVYDGSWKDWAHDESLPVE